MGMDVWAADAVWIRAMVGNNNGNGIGNWQLALAMNDIGVGSGKNHNQIWIWDVDTEHGCKHGAGGFVLEDCWRTL